MNDALNRLGLAWAIAVALLPLAIIACGGGQ